MPVQQLNAPRNFRDVGATVNWLLGTETLLQGVLYRGGQIDFLEDITTINSPRTVINLRKGENPESLSAATLHLPAPDSVEVYFVERGSNRKWILSVLRALVLESTSNPVYIHCALGRDRTGIIIGALLAALEVPRSAIQLEYELSEGKLRKDLFAKALDAFYVQEYFEKLDITALRKRFAAS